MRRVGVLGGMGPAATVDFMARLQAATRGARDQDHVPLIVDLNPQVPNRNDALAGEGPSPEPVLVDMAQRLETAGAEALVIVCNSAHAWADAVQAAVEIPLLNLVDLTADAVREASPGVMHVGLLAASACLDAELYENALAARGVTALVLEDEEREAFMALLYRIKSGDTGAETKAEMHRLAFTLIDRGATLMVSACTEAPLVLGAHDLPVPLIDSTQVLVDATLEFARGEG